MSQMTFKEFRLLPVAAAVLLACGNAYAETDPEVLELITPGSSISIGLGGNNGGDDAKRFSQYTGLNESGSVLLDLEINRRDDASGLWTIISGRNLGLDTRELSFSQSRQGNWKYALDYNETVRRDPYIIHTGLAGIGSTTPTVNLIATPDMPAAWATANGLDASNGVAGHDVELQQKRTAIGVGGDKWITPEVQFELSFRNEEKKGARLFGRAGLDSSDMQFRPNNVGASANGGWAVLLTPEPIDSVTRQLEARLNYNRDNYSLSAGYYGSFYVNHNGSLNPNVPGTLNRGPLWTNCATAGCSTVQQLASSSVALPPDNQAHQFYLTGNYAFTKDTRSNFKLSYTRATQDESFTSAGLTPAATAPDNLGGLVNTLLLSTGLSTRPMKDLSVNASLRHEDRDDKTPIHVYNTNGIAGNALNNTTNWPSGSQTRTTARADATYRLANGYSFLLGGDWERKKSPLPPSNTALFANQVLFRPELTEKGLRAELRKALSPTLNGALSAEYKKRRGGDSDWVTTNGVSTADPATSNILVAFDPAGASGNRVLPIMYMDRNRTKARASLDWEANEKLSLQGVIEHTEDDYLRAYSPTLLAAQTIPTVPGARTIIGKSASLDATYSLTDEWRANGFWTHSYNRWNVNKASLGDDTRNTTDTVGLGVKGDVTSSLTIGVNVLTTRDTTTFTNLIAGTPAAGQAPGNIAGWSGQTLPGNFLPDIHYKTNKLNLHGKYALNKSSDVLMVASYQQFKTDDWQWDYNGVPFVYSDNTTVSQPTDQRLRFLGASYILRF